MKLMNVRHREWLRWARRELKAGRVGDDYTYPVAYVRHAHRWVKRGDWKPRIQRKYAEILEMDDGDA